MHRILSVTNAIIKNSFNDNIGSMNKEELAPVLGKLVAGLYIVTLKDGEEEAGFLASWVQQAGFEPPCITIAFNKERTKHFSLLVGSGKLVLNIMAKENGKTMSAFFKPPAEGKSIFDDLDTHTDKTGIPILKDSIGYLECEYRSEMQSGDHIIILCEVINGKLTNSEFEPAVHTRPDGFKY
jgi:flavin reductase (DIM6/NTAB) family NADH-FMN oxidoreductase RutF